MSILISPLPSQPWAPDLIPKLQCHSRGLVAPKAGCWRVIRIVCGNCNSETSPGWFRSCRENELKFSSRHPKLQFFPWKSVSASFPLFSPSSSLSVSVSPSLLLLSPLLSSWLSPKRLISRRFSHVFFLEFYNFVFSSTNSIVLCLGLWSILI